MHPQLPGIAAPSEEAPAPFDDFPALNTDNCSVCRLLAHLGHAISCLADITIAS